MNFHRPWTIFALDAEHDAYGMARIAQAHNTCMSELASARAERDIACTALCPHGLDIAAKYENAKRELAAARALLREVEPRVFGPITEFHEFLQRIDAALAKYTEPNLAVPSDGTECGPEEERIEAAYWRFDARHKGYGQWKQAPMSERDAFKAEMRNALAAEKTRAEMRLVAKGWRKPDVLAGERREGGEYV